MLNKNQTYVFIKRTPFAHDGKIFPKQRAQEIASCSNSSERDRKLFVWQLLEEAVETVTGKPLSDFDIEKKNGKWQCKDFYFSLTHKNDVVAVAVSLSPIGIDVEENDFERFAKFKSERLLCGKENELYMATAPSERVKLVNILWTKKESLFKKGGFDLFIAQNIDTVGVKSVTYAVSTENKNYYLSVVSDDENVELSALDGISANKI